MRAPPQVAFTSETERRLLYDRSLLLAVPRSVLGGYWLIALDEIVAVLRVRTSVVARARVVDWTFVA